MRESDENTNSVPPYQEPAEVVTAALGTETRLGLSETEARKRLERFGRNELTAEKPVPGWKKFLAQFKDVLVILLLVAALISAALWLVERARVAKLAEAPDLGLRNHRFQSVVFRFK